MRIGMGNVYKARWGKEITSRAGAGLIIQNSFSVEQYANITICYKNECLRQSIIMCGFWGGWGSLRGEGTPFCREQRPDGRRRPCPLGDSLTDIDSRAKGFLPPQGIWQTGYNGPQSSRGKEQELFPPGLEEYVPRMRYGRHHRYMAAIWRWRFWMTRPIHCRNCSISACWVFSEASSNVRNVSISLRNALVSSLDSSM